MKRFRTRSGFWFIQKSASGAACFPLQATAHDYEAIDQSVRIICGIPEMGYLAQLFREEPSLRTKYRLARVTWPSESPFEYHRAFR